LFEKDKLLFSFLLTTKIMLGQKTLDHNELRFLLQGSTSMDLAEPNLYKEWLSDRAWSDILALSQIHAFGDFKTIFKSQAKKWETVIDSNSPIDVVTQILGEKYDPFRKLCVLRCLRPDVMVPAVMSFIADKMGNKFIEPPPFNMKECFSDSKCFTPLIFVLTPGAAPMTELLKLADEMGYGNKLLAISLGQGQGPIAENAIQDGADKGSLFFDNIK
jgi:dynein heavy chain